METLIDSLKYYQIILLSANIAVTLLSAWHALLYKRDPKASVGWLAVILMFPVFGYVLYFLFGINRIRTRARKLAGKLSFSGFFSFEALREEILPADAPQPASKEFAEIENIADSITGMPLTSGNRIDILHNGDHAYPEMLDAIEGAVKSVYLSSYIFKTDLSGKKFIDKLANARNRGVEVKVILDGIGEYYSFPRAGRLLKKQGVHFARFIPPSLVPPSIHINLRNHRKILVVDGRMAFTGGMNIDSNNLVKDFANKSKVVDVHFRLQGPVVAQIEKVFIDDWNFVTRQSITAGSHEGLTKDSSVKCRVISEGPNEDFNKLATVLTGATASARKRVMIMTPYFLPNREMISALQTAALKGVDVDILLPEKSNLPYVHWATRNMLWELLQRGVRIFYQPPPFVHSKLFIVDDFYTHIGTANIDARSLRLNFELAVEVYDREFNALISEHMLNCRKRSRRVTMNEMDSRPLLTRTRDALAWLLYPYL